MRIIGGKLAGRHLTSPTDTRVRPTAEHVREGMMELVTPYLAKARLLDLFAGTGALGLEAISRGAARCDFVEFGPGALHALKSNIALLRLREKTRVFKRDGVQFAEALEPGSYDLAFADPPYESKILDRVVASWKARPFAKILVVEHARTHKLPKGIASRAFVDTTVTVYGGLAVGRAGGRAACPERSEGSGGRAKVGNGTFPSGARDLLHPEKVLRSAQEGPTVPSPTRPRAHAPTRPPEETIPPFRASERYPPFPPEP